MPIETQRWRVRQVLSDDHQDLARQVGLHPVVVALLQARGLEGAATLDAFFNGSLEDIPAPTLMADLVAARDRIVRAIGAGELITVFGDYDVDGITATATLVVGLTRLGANVTYHIPHRTEEGYGLNCEALETIASQGTRLVISVDCGISAAQEAQCARSLGLELIVTDHHQPPLQRVDALAVINPKQNFCPYPFKDLAGVGVAYQLLVAVHQALGSAADLSDMLEFVAMGTIADVVPLAGPNRIMVHEGIRRLSRTQNQGLRALLAVCGMEGRELSANNVAFALAPRINACGRIGCASLAVDMLLTDDPIQAASLAQRLNELNAERQTIEQQILDEAMAMLRVEDCLQHRAIVLASSSWHPGVIGIVASRLVESFHRPVLLFSIEGDMVKGSGRSIKGFHLYQALAHHAPLLTKYGGHELAAGLSLTLANFEAFRQAFLRFTASVLNDDDLLPTVFADMELSSNDVSLELIEQLQKMEPFGMGNPTPVFLLRDMETCQVRELSAGKHFKARLRQGMCTFDAIAWRMGEHAGDFAGSMDLIGTLERNEYNGQISIQMVLRSWRRSDSRLNGLVGELQKAAQESERQWVYCRSPETAELVLEQFAGRSNPKTPVAVALQEMHGLPSGVFLGVRQRRLETIMAPETEAPQGRVILLEPPYHAISLASVSALFGREDLEQEQQVLVWLLPDRDRLAELFRWFREQGDVTKLELVDLLQTRGLKKSESIQAAKNVCRIFAELGVIKVDDHQIVFTYQQGAVRLDDSRWFRECQLSRQRTTAWYQGLTEFLKTK